MSINMWSFSGKTTDPFFFCYIYIEMIKIFHCGEKL